jgi:hypothetical protein|tara:strand:+ start:629 stop:1246 length:618 start_codon:yes stop_codon:yes gene_type:complete
VSEEKKEKRAIMGYKFQMTSGRLMRLKHDYELGLSTRAALSRKFKIPRTKLWQIAQELDWEFAGKREDLLKDFEKKSFKRLNSQRMDAVEQHAIELQFARDALRVVETQAEADMLERRVDILLKCIKGERTAFGLPNEFKQVETKTENVFRVEEMVKSLDKKRDDLKVINPVERITNESDKEGREGTTDGISLSAPKGDYEKGSP